MNLIFDAHQDLAYNILSIGRDYSRSVDETRQLELDDGSQLSLNTATRVKVDYNDELRRVVLYDGEILLDSGVDRRSVPRPLVVDTVHGRVTARRRLGAGSGRGPEVVATAAFVNQRGHRPPP